MEQDGSRPGGITTHFGHRVGVDSLRELNLLLGPVHGGVGGSIDDELWRHGLEGFGDGSWHRQVRVASAVGHHVETLCSRRALAEERMTELTVLAKDERAHRQTTYQLTADCA